MKQFLINHPIVGAIVNILLPGATYLILQTRVYFGVALILGIILVALAGSQPETQPDSNTFSMLGGFLIWAAFGIDGYFECKNLQKKK